MAGSRGRSHFELATNLEICKAEAWAVALVARVSASGAVMSIPSLVCEATCRRHAAHCRIVLYNPDPQLWPRSLRPGPSIIRLVFFRARVAHTHHPLLKFVWIPKRKQTEPSHESTNGRRRKTSALNPTCRIIQASVRRGEIGGKPRT